MEVALSGTADFMMKGHLDRFLQSPAVQKPSDARWPR